VLHTRSRQEREVERALSNFGIQTYLPVARRTRFYAHRRREVSMPLFPSYVFMHGDVEATYLALGTKRVARVVNVADQARLEFEMEQIRRAITSNEDFLPVDALVEGVRARVARGPLKDVEGIVEQRRFPNRLVLQIQTLGQATSLEVDADLLEPV
jgi:transcription antitermination factor NusG